MDLGPCRVSVSCCFTTGLGAGWGLEDEAEPAVWPQFQERKEGLAHRALVVSGGWCEPSRGVAAWLEAAVGLSPSLIWSCTPQHPQVCACGQELPACGQCGPRSGAGEALSLSKAASAVEG